MKSVMTYPPDKRKLQKMIMDYVLSMESISEDDVEKLNADAASVKEEIEHLVSANLLRYQSDGSVIFHSRLVQWAMINNKLKFYVKNFCLYPVAMLLGFQAKFSRMVPISIRVAKEQCKYA